MAYPQLLRAFAQLFRTSTASHLGRLMARFRPSSVVVNVNAFNAASRQAHFDALEGEEERSLIKDLRGTPYSTTPRNGNRHF